MSLLISTQSELLKIKRTAAFWVTILGAAFIPTVYFLLFLGDPAEGLEDHGTQPWTVFFRQAWMILAVVVLPMYTILVSTLVTQIEFRNNTWKQVFASPQSFGNIFFSKFFTIQFMILFFFLLFNTLMILVAVTSNLINPDFLFLKNKIDWEMLVKLNFKTYISILGISAIQYWLSLRFKNFVVPIGIGLGLGIGSLVAWASKWVYIYKYPYSFPVLTLQGMKPGRPLIENHEWSSIGVFAFFILLGFLDMKMRKEKG
jgi:hypothetical protein